MYIEKTYNIFMYQGDTTKAFALRVGSGDRHDYNIGVLTTDKLIAEFLTALEAMKIIDGYDIGKKVNTYGKD